MIGTALPAAIDFWTWKLPFRALELPRNCATQNADKAVVRKLTCYTQTKAY